MIVETLAPLAGSSDHLYELNSRGRRELIKVADHAINS